MRIGLIALLIVSLGCTACGRVERTLVPVEGSAALANGDFFGNIQMTDGSELAISNGGRVGRWICGEAEFPGRDFCVPVDEVQALVDMNYTAGAEAVFLIPVAGAAAIWAGSDELKRRERAKEDAEDAELRRQGVLPPLPTPEARRRGETEQNLNVCLDIPYADRESTDTRALAMKVWRERDRCLTEAVDWFSAHGESEKARRLYFVAAGRWRYEALVCRGRDPGVDAPRPALIGETDGGWMGEYRAVVADSRTYDFTLEGCTPGAEAVAVRRFLVSSFPLTRRPPASPSEG